MKLGLLSLALLLSSAVVAPACAPEDSSTADDGASKKKKTSSKDDSDDKDDDAKKDDPKIDEPKEAPVDPLTFAACTEPYSGDCATVQLPVDRAKPEGDTIEIFVTRFANPAKPRGAMWLLQGGPGGSVSGFEGLVAEYKVQFPDLTIYGLEHRGVGRSTRLDPIQSEQSIEALKAKWGDNLAQFSTTGASQDLHEVIRRTRRADEPVFVYGVSYGTYWAQRYLTMFPKEPAGVVLDSVVPMKGLYFSGSDEEGGSVAKHWSELCDANATCAGKFGGAPTWPKLQASFKKFGTAHCPAAGLTRERLTSLRGLLTFNEFGFAILPVAHRFERCTADDVAFLKSFFQHVDSFQRGGFSVSKGPNDEDSNQSLYFNVAFSELWELPAPSQAVLLQRYNAAVLPSGGIDQLAELREYWPVYAHDEYVGKYPVTDVPVLIMNGTLDSQTPYDLVSTIASSYTKPHQTFVKIPNANHGVAYPYEGVPCGLTVMRNFVTDPKAKLDISCTATPAPVSLTGSVAYNQSYFGTADLWEGKAGSASIKFSAADLAKLEAFEARRRMLETSMRY